MTVEINGFKIVHKKPVFKSQEEKKKREKEAMSKIYKILSNQKEAIDTKVKKSYGDRQRD